MREEAVVSKQAVVREELIIRRKSKTATEVVEADLRRERVDIQDDQGAARNVGGQRASTTDNSRNAP